MIVVTQERFQKRIVYYRKVVDDTGRVTRCDRFDCITRVETTDAGTFIFIADRYGIIRPAPYEYINKTRRGKSINSRIQMALAIQSYYTFCDIFACDPTRITARDAEKFKQFLLGNDVKTEKGSKVCMRTPETVKGYKGMVRRFLETYNYSTEGFQRGETTVAYEPTAGGSIQPVIRSSGDPDLRSGRLHKLTAPKHFDPQQAKAIVSSMKERKDWMMLCIFRLGYGYGLRRGEILGLTKNDVVAKINKSTGEKYYSLIIRNRISDRIDQCAKTLKHPFEVGQYDAKSYQRSFHEVDIDESMYNLIMDVYNDSRDIKKHGVNAYQKIRKVSRADDFKGQENFYIFVYKGNNGWNRLSGQTVNNHLRKYFDEAGLDLANVSHAMRHSFAMFHAHYAINKLDAEALRRLMRHACSESTAIYFNMPREALKELREQYSVELNELIPEFKWDKKAIH